MQRQREDSTDPLSKRTPIARREFLRRVAILGVSAGALPTLIAGCAAPPASPPATSAPAAKPAATSAPAVTAAPAATAAAPAAQPTPKRGGELVQAINWTVPTMDPHLTTLPHHIIYENVYDGLLRLELVDPKTGEFKVTGLLAESWQQPDARTIIFKLRQGVKFHDGSEFDAEVAKWNVLRCRDHEKSYSKAPLSNVATVTATDKYTLEIKTKTDNAALLRVLAFVKGGLVRMVSKAAFDKNGEAWLQRNAVGTGPFKFRQWISDDRVLLDRNPDYFLMGADKKALPYLDSLVLRYIPDPTASLQDMRAGSLHLLQWVVAKDVEIIKNDPKLDYLELPWAGQIYFEVGFNTQAPPFNDVKVRQAALYGIDRVGMHKALGFGVGSPYYYPFHTPGTMGYDDSLIKYEYNPAKVKELLTAAGYPNGIDIELKVIAREPENTIGEFAQQMWTAVGIRTKLVSQERTSWIDAMKALKFQSCFWRGSLDAVVDPELSRRLFTCGGAANWAQWCDKEVDKLMDDGLATLDPKQRAEIYKKVWTIIQERAYGGAGYLAPIIDARRREINVVNNKKEVPNLAGAWLG